MKINRTRYDTFINVICVGLLVGTLIYLLLAWNSIPEKIPGHYNSSGIIDRWGNKRELLFIQLISWIIYIGLVMVEKFPQIWNTGVEITDENKERIYRITQNMLGREKLLMVTAFSFITIYSSQAKVLPIWFLPIFLIFIFGSLTFFIIKLVRQNKE